MYLTKEELEEQKAFTNNLTFSSKRNVSVEMATTVAVFNQLKGIAVISSCPGKVKTPARAEIGVVMVDKHAEETVREIYRRVLAIYMDQDYGEYRKRWKDLRLVESVVPFRMVDTRHRKCLVIDFHVRMKEDNREGLFTAFIERLRRVADQTLEEEKTLHAVL